MKLFVGKNNEKYDFWDVSRDRKKKPITLSDRILELVAAAMAVLLLILTGVLYSKAPDTVPSHGCLVGEGSLLGACCYYVGGYDYLCLGCL